MKRPRPPLPLARLEIDLRVQIRVEIVLARDAGQGEQGVAARVRERRPHASWSRRLADWADGPLGGQPYTKLT